jgi:hypothetical protein
MCLTPVMNKLLKRLHTPAVRVVVGGRLKRVKSTLHVAVDSVPSKQENGGCPEKMNADALRGFAHDFAERYR